MPIPELSAVNTQKAILPGFWSALSNSFDDGPVADFSFIYMGEKLTCMQCIDGSWAIVGAHPGTHVDEY